MVELKLSASQIGMMKNCQKKWDFVYRQGLVVDSSSSQILGSAFHAGMAEYALTRNKSSAIAKAFDYIQEYQDLEDYEERQKLLLGMMDYYPEKLLPEDWNVLDVEYKFETETFKGTIDLVVSTPLGVIIVDYKTTGSYVFNNPYASALDEQLTLYALHYTKHSVDFTAQYHVSTHVPAGIKWNISNGHPSKAGARTTLDKFKQSLAEREYPESNFDFNDTSVLESYKILPEDSFFRFDLTPITERRMVYAKNSLKYYTELAINMVEPQPACSASICNGCPFMKNCYEEIII
jgi:hypothetical protein